MADAGMVIVGGGMAGARAVVSLRANGFHGPITLVSEETLLPYDRPPLSKAMLVEETEPQPVHLLDQGMIASLNASFVRGVKAIGIDRTAKALVLENGRTISYEKLLIATGAKPRRLSIEGGELAYTLRDFADGDHLRHRLRQSRSAAIVGGGFIGLEVASSARKLGLDVTLIEAQPRILMRGVPEEIAKVVHARHVEAGVTMQVGTALKAVETGGVRLADGRKVKAGIVVAGIGAAPEIALAQAAGLAVDNGIACDATLQTSDPDIYAAGDCCSFPHGLFGNKRMRLEAWRNATDQANVATGNMLGASKPYMAVPWFWSDQYDLSLQIAGNPADGPEVVKRQTGEQSFVMFHRDPEGRLVGASGIGPGNSIARDVKLAEMLIAKRSAPTAEQLADPSVQLKVLLKG
ncbi:MAG: FAD-dependent oxidoreductase [Aestuariivirga sp.]|nr:FAD-dependent oxidoreductase [Aestuariivirga sp.]MCA3561875.1 FAD-dependent oxidoreductase [Aestuariivirga sp.]